MEMNTDRNELPTTSDVPLVLKMNDNNRETDCNEMSDELFSDEFGTDDTLCHSPDIFEVTDDNCSILNSIKTPVLYSNVLNTTPDCTAIAKAPLSLIPFLSNINESWSCDLETPQAKRKEQIHASPVVDEVVGSLTSPERIICLKQYTPVDSALKNMDSECACTSPILNSRKVRRRPRRRVLKLSTSVDSVHVPKLDQPAPINVPEDNHLSTNVEKCTDDINNSSVNVTLHNTNLDKVICDTDEKAILIGIDDDTIVHDMQISPSSNLQNVSALAIQNIQNSKDKNKIDGGEIKILSEKCTLNSKTIFCDVDHSNKDSTSMAQINYLTQDINIVDKTCLEADKESKSMIYSVRSSSECNDNAVVTEMNSSTQDFFGNVSFSSIDKLCQSDIDQGKKETVDCATINNTEISIENVASKNPEIIGQNKILNKTKSNQDDNVNCTQLPLKNDVFDHVATSSVKFPNDSGAHVVSIDRESLVDRVKNIKRLLDSRRRTSELKSVDIPVEDFTKEATALEKAVTLSESKNNKCIIRSQSGFIPFSKFCLPENENEKLDTADKLKNDLPIDTLSTNKSVNESETKVVEFLISTTENVKDSSKLQDNNDIDVSSALSNVLVCSKCELESVDDIKCTRECTSQTLAFVNKDSLNSSGTSEPLTRNTSASLSPEESNDISIVVENDSLIDSEMWKLGEMTLGIANDIEDFSEWEYKSNDTLQKLSQQMNIRANKTSSVDSKVNKTKQSKPYVKVHCNNEISEQVQQMNHFGENTGNVIEMNEKPTGTDHLTNSMQRGFITVNDKNISINDDRLHAANKIFKDIEGIDRENAKVIDINSPLNVTRENCNMDSKEQGDIANTVETVQCGFSTASGKAVFVSKLNLHAVEKLYEQIDDSNYSGKENCSVNSKNLLKMNSWPTLNKRNKFTGDNRIHSRRVLQSKKLIATESGDANESILSLIKDLDVTVKNKQKKRGTILNVNKVVGLQNAFTECKLKRKHEESNAGLEQLPMLDSLGGFVTAGGKSLTVSDRALKRAKYCFQDDDMLNAPILSKDPLFSEISTDQYSVKNESNTRKYHIVKTISNESDLFHGFSFEDLEMSNSLATKMKSILNNQGITEFENPEINLNSTNNLSKQLRVEYCVPKRGALVGESSILQPMVRKTLPGLPTANGKSVEVTEDIRSKVKATYCETSDLRKSRQIVNTSHFEIENPNEFANKNNSPENIKEEELCNSSKISYIGINSNIAEFTNIGFSTASGKKLSISNEALSKARLLFVDEKIPITSSCKEQISKETSTSHFEIENLDELANKNNSPENIKEQELCNSSKINYIGINSNIAEFTNIGFSTASGKKLSISNKALSKARLLFVDEKIPITSSCKEQISKETSVNMTDINSDHTNYHDINISKETVTKTETLSSNKLENQCSIETPKRSSLNVESKCIDKNETKTVCFGFSTAAGQQIKISEEALSKAKTLLSSALEDTQDINYSTKTDASTLTPASITHSSTVLSEPGPLPKRKIEDISDNTPLGRYRTSKFKRIRFNDEFQVRKLFTEDTDCSEEKSKVKDRQMRNCREALWSTSDCTFVEKNDRVMFPQCYLQKSIDNVESAVPDIPRYSDINNSDRRISVKFCQDRKPLISDEVMASTVALLADENDSDDRINWSSGFTCNSTVVEDRHMNTWPIILNENDDITSEGSPSPILRRRDRFNLHKRTTKNNLKSLERDSAEESGGSNHNDRIMNSCISEMTNVYSEKVDKVATTYNHDTSNCEARCSLTIPHKNNNLEYSVTSRGKYKIRHSADAIIAQSTTISEMQPNFVMKECDTPLLKQFLETEKMDTNFDGFVNISEKRLAAALEQDKLISAKKQNKPNPIKGSLLTIRDVNRETRISWRQLTGGVAPVPYSYQELFYRQIGTEILKITAATAASYKFRCTEFYGVNAVRNIHGLDVGDGARLILDENNCASISEFIRSFMASPGVDPALLPNGWVENHYRWIVWKLASIDRMKFGSIVMPRMLTPSRVMKELKYRYDREIDKSQRSALRRILEKDDSACKRLILCVASVVKQRDNEDAGKGSKTLETPRWKVELTDGWYSIPASIDVAMANHITSGKVQEGTKLIICGAELMNCDQGCSPLEIPTDVCLRIHTNSTRRARWDAKLGYQVCGGPIPTSLKAVDPNGGQIGKLIVTVARVYPILYREKTPDDQLIFRNARCEEKAALAYERECQSRAEAIYSSVLADLEMPKRKCSDSSETDSMDMDGIMFCDEVGLSDSERQKLIERHYAKENKFRQELESKLRESLPHPRQVTPILKIRIVDCERTAIVKAWTRNEEVHDIFKEGNRISACNLYASGKRAGEIQLTAGRYAVFNREASNNITYPRRTFIPLSDITATGFNPPFGEFDTVGIISSVGVAPHGMKNLEVAYLAYPNSDSSSSAYLSILFWQGIATHGYSDIVSVGCVISCSNLEWRRSTLCGIPAAYCTDRTVFTRNPRQNHLRVPFENLNNRIKDTVSYAAKCASEISLEIVKKPALSRTPGQGTPNRSLLLSDKLTPSGVSRTSRSGTPMDHNSSTITPVKSSIQSRLDKLYWYGEPPELSPIVVNNSSDKVMQDFRPLFRTPDKKSSIGDQDSATLKSKS